MGKNVQNLKILWKSQPHECDYCMHEKARIYPDMKTEKGKDDWISNTEEHWDMYK